MTSIQVILIVLCLLATILGSLAFRSKLGYRLLAVFFFITATIFVVFPDTTSRIAHVLGVGRGADLLLYLAVLGGVHSFLLLYMRTRRLERRMTDQVRAIAIRDALWLGGESALQSNPIKYPHAKSHKSSTAAAGR